MCAALGYRSCDRCGNVVFPANLTDPIALAAAEELCGYCIGDIEATHATEASRAV